MKRGVAGVRLCDVSGCYDRWPCSRHGTLMAGVPEGFWNSCLDISVCPKCGYQCCGCPIPAEPAAWQPPEGWTYRPRTSDYRACYENLDLPLRYGLVLDEGACWRCEAAPPWGDLIPEMAIYRAVRLVELERAFKAVPILTSEEPVRPLPAYLEPLRQALERIEPKLRPGWHHVAATADGVIESYLHDQLPRGYGCVFQIANGWTFGKAQRAWLSPNRAMLEAEEWAGEVDDQA